MNVQGHCHWCRQREQKLSVLLECQQQNCITMANNKCFSRCVRFNASPWPSLEPFLAKEMPSKGSATHNSCPWTCRTHPRPPELGHGSSKQLSLGTAGSSSQESSSIPLRVIATVRTSTVPGEREIVASLLIPKLISHFFSSVKLPFGCTKYLLSVQWKEFHVGEGIIHFPRL